MNWRYIILAHRYPGIAISIVVLLWCLSGVVMMYVPYPTFEHDERLAGLDQLDLSAIDRWIEADDRDDLSAQHFSMDTLSGTTVLRGMSASGQAFALELSSGELLSVWHNDQLVEIANAYARNRNWSPPNATETVNIDQWTVQGQFAMHRPMLKVRNPDGNEWYLSGQTGEVVQTTTKPERLWNWLGSVVHWLYPTRLRQHVAVWSQTVIWLTIIGSFLTITGIAIGIRQFKSGREGRRSPYYGLTLWHHYAGLVFGGLTLTWLLSGLLSMNPWGALESRSPQSDREILNSGVRSLKDIRAALNRARAVVPEDTVRIESSHWLGRLYLIAYDREGARTRIHDGAIVAGVDSAEVATAMNKLKSVANSKVELLHNEDRYYYGQHTPVETPVFRVSYPDGERYYLSAKSGALLRLVDNNSRWYRWAFNALHTGDFSRLSRSRPVWDLFMLVLLSGVTVGVASGTWLAIKRIRRIDLH